MHMDRAGQWHKVPIARAELEPMPYQHTGIDWLKSRQCSLLADDMGLGKTCQAIGLINTLPPTARILIICPNGLRINWLRELAQWLTVERRSSVVKKYVPATPIVIVNYDALAKHEVQLRKVEWDLIVCDECHTIKNAYSAKCRQVLGDGFTEPLRAKRKLLLTGTPILNRPIEIWTLLRFLGLQMSRDEFGNRFCNGGDFTGSSNAPELRQLVASYALRRLKADVLTDLPAKRRYVVRIAPNGAARAACSSEKSFEQQAAEVGPMVRKVSLSEMSRLRIASARAKIAMPEVQAILREAVESAGKVVIFCVHNEIVAEVAKLFQKACVTYTGSHSTDERQRAVDRFQGDPGCKVFVGTLGAGSTGITLTAASHMIFCEHDWTPGITQQAEDRIWRYGQKNACTIQHLVIDGSIDAREIEVQIEKQKIISSVV